MPSRRRKRVACTKTGGKRRTRRVVECGGEEREDAAFGRRHGTRSTHPPVAPAAGEPWIFGPATACAASAPGACVMGPPLPARQWNFFPHSTTLWSCPCRGTDQADWLARLASCPGPGLPDGPVDWAGWLAAGSMTEPGAVLAPGG